MVMDKTTSKTSCLKALLLKAWRERWTDLQWGINIKTVLPRGVSGDVYNLADCILQQAIVGAGANQLVLSYLKHSLSAQLVSHAAVLQRLSKYNQWQKLHCVLALLEFLEGMLPGVTCSGKPEETVLATAILGIVSWLLTILLQCKGLAQVTQKAALLLGALLGDDFYVAMICLGRHCDPELFLETKHKCADLHTAVSDSVDDFTKTFLAVILKLEAVDVSTLSLPVACEPWPGSLIQFWFEVYLVGNSGATTSALCQHLRLFRQLKGYDAGRTCAEIIRGAFLALHDVNQTPHESQWGAFAFLKVPHLLVELAISEVALVSGVELLLQHDPLLDAMDATGSCSSVECLLGELLKVRLVGEAQVKRLLEKRQMPAQIKMEAAAPTTAGIPKVIIRAEPTLAGILKMLSTDYHKIQDALLGMLHQVLSGKSFELILAVATVQGQLRTLVARLVRFNECSKLGGDKLRSQMFDISFLMLVAIVQNYGSAAVLDPEHDDDDSLFDQWVRHCMVERQKPKPPEQMLRLGDPATVEALLQQFNAGEPDFKTVKWQEVLFSVAGVMHEVLVAWEQGALVAADVKRILDALRGKMCCLPLAAAAWLCAYMRTAPQENLLKPVNMVQQLLAPPATEEESLRDRWQLTCEIIRRMQDDIQLPLQAKNNQDLVSRQPAIEQLQQCWSSAIKRGWLDHESAKIVRCLYETAGAKWIVASVVQELVKLRYRDQLQRGADLALAVFYVDVEECTVQLLSAVLPQALYHESQNDSIVEPQLIALAKLTARSIYAAFESVSEIEGQVLPSKRPRLTESPQDNLKACLRNLLSTFEEGVRGGYITQQTYFAFYLIRTLVEVKSTCSSAILSAIPPILITDLLRTLPNLFTYSLIVNLHEIGSSGGRTNMAKDLCVLRNHCLRIE